MIGTRVVLEVLLLLLLLLEVVLVVLELLAVAVELGKTVVRVPLIVVAMPDTVEEVVSAILWAENVSVRRLLAMVPRLTLRS